MNLQYLVGLSVINAEKVAKSNNMRLRVVEEDGRPAIVTRDYRLDRVNVVVEGGLVTEVTGVG